MGIVRTIRNFFTGRPDTVGRIQMVTETGEGFYVWDGKMYQSDIIRACIRPKTQAVGKIIGKHIRETANKEGKTISVNPEPYIRYLLSEPNPYMTGQMLQEKLANQLALNGNAFALLIRDEKYIEDAEIYREKGTDRSKYYRGQVDKYRWQEYGSSYLPSDMNAAYLYAQLEMAEQITRVRMDRWNQYLELLMPLAEAGRIALPYIPEYCAHNAHMFYIKTKDMEERSRLIAYLKEKDILSVFHYVPLHSAPAGKKYGRFHGEDRYTTKESERLLRLPLFYKLTADETEYIAEQVKAFYASN